MTRLEIILDGRSYVVSCETGQESRLRRLAAYVNERLRVLRANSATGSELHLLALVSLMLADRVFDLTDEVAALKASLPEPEHPAALKMEELAGRLEDLASRVEKS